MADIQYEIKETLGVLSTSSKGWQKERNLISWNGAAAKRVLLLQRKKLRF